MIQHTTPTMLIDGIMFHRIMKGIDRKTMLLQSSLWGIQNKDYAVELLTDDKHSFYISSALYCGVTNHEI